MEYKYEIIERDAGLPLRLMIHSIERFNLHWHDKMEFILVLEGSVNVKIGNTTYLMEEDDLILVNSNELHSVKETEESNTLLILQINPDFYNISSLNFRDIRFDNIPIKDSDKGQCSFTPIKKYIAEIVWRLNKKEKGCKLKVGSYLYSIGEYLINNHHYTLIEEDVDLKEKDFERLRSIIKYIDENIHRKLTLKEVAEESHFNYYYLSHFIRDKMGISFQQYLNTVRLKHALNELIETNKSITQISEESGFVNVNAFNRVLREEYDCTPSEYRERYKRITIFEGDYKKDKSYLDVDRESALKKLFTHIDLSEEKVSYIKPKKIDMQKIQIDINQKGEILSHYWNNLITFGRAKEGLNSNWQNQLKEIQKNIGFKYIRFHGIFNDEMMVYNILPSGKVEYNWTYVDELFDFLLSVGLKPFIGLDFMPLELTRSDETIFWWKGNISPPKDITKWTSLVKELVIHSINRYGLKEVESWYFEVWNEPEYSYAFWAGSKEEYFEFYKETAKAIKSISNKLKVGGPAITHNGVLENKWFEDFLIYCRDKNADLDFLSFHIYPEYVPDIEMEKSIIESQNGNEIFDLFSKAKRIYYDRNHTSKTIDTIKEKIKVNLNKEMEIHITEWNGSSQLGNLIHDTAYIGIYIIKNVLESINKVKSLGYWTFTDLMEENKLGIAHFHGGFGLINKDGLKKSSYYAYYLLSKLGNEVVKQDKDYIITKNNEDIQILAYNFAYFDNLFLKGETSHIDSKERYNIYESKNEKNIEINLKGLMGRYKISRYKLNRESGSVFDQWLKIGGIENMTSEETEYLKSRSKPDMEIAYRNIEENHRLEMNLPVHGAELIILNKIIK